MRIVIDMQGAQAIGTRNRGIGRYALALSKEMIRLRGEHEVILVLNGMFPDTIEPIRAAFAELLAQENICVWEAVGPVNLVDKSNDARRRAAEISREAFFTSLQPDIVLNTSIFEVVDDSVTSIGGFTSQLSTAVVLYDLIPMIFRNIYLKDPVIELCYLNKLDHLRRADLLLSISSSSGRDAVNYLGFLPSKVVNISTACESHFRPLAVDETMHVHLQKNYGLVRPFVMYTGGIDHRKNVEGLIRAYASLPKRIRNEHQLAVVCSIQPPDRKRLLQLAKKEGLWRDELVITGFVSEKDLLALYNSCKLFVFPSWYEGFGLPALEAMTCGRAVIGSNTSSVPEVIGREDALFDPLDDKAIARKIEEVLTNDDYRAVLECHGLTQAKKFSWEQTARRAWQALEAFVTQRSRVVSASVLPMMAQRPRLAYVSPLPPEPSGIADYSAELLPELAQYYDIEVIVAQNDVSAPWVCANCPIHDINWFRSNARRFDRVIYHFGNCVFHSHMFDLLKEIPGVVVLHDFFLSDIVAQMDINGVKPHAWAQALVYAHGWSALQARYQRKDSDVVVRTYPCNLEVLQQAHGVIVHSDYSRQLAREWYGSGTTDYWEVIPHLRVPVIKTDRNAARRKLGVKEGEFIVCSFGILGPHKLNHRLLDAWLASPLAEDPHCHLVFVGQNHDGCYGVELVRNIRASRATSRIKITGRVDAATYQTWLAAADVGVQLRTLTRGETSGAVLDCMNHGLATIVNAHGSMADFPANAVWLLSDEFLDEDLIEALTVLWKDTNRRIILGQYAHQIVQTQHHPRRCAQRYTKAIEHWYRRVAAGLPGMFDALAKIEPALSVEDNLRFATSLANNFPLWPHRRQLLLDISELVQRDAKSGVQRVVRSLLRELLLNPPAGWIVEPVYATVETHYRYARRFTSQFLGVYEGWVEDELVDAYPNDIFLGLDLQALVVSAQKDYLLAWRRRGIKIFFVVYDVLPVLFPQFFTEGIQAIYQNWLECINHFDGLACISRTVADEVAVWLRNNNLKRLRPLRISWFHLGANIDNSILTLGLPDDANHMLEEFARRPTFLTVGTVEPRKGHAKILGAFELLWKQDIDVNFVIVGKQGWMVEQLVEQIHNHAELGKRLFWLDSVSDEYLEKVYDASTCLIAASDGEGFGLPLIEAAQHKVPIIARDIPIFREVAGEHAFYFKGNESGSLAEMIKKWLALYSTGQHPKSDDMPWLTWEESAKMLIDKLGIKGRNDALVESKI